MNTKKRSNFQVCMQLIGLVKPMLGYMMLAILTGLLGHLCASYITIFGSYALLDLLDIQKVLSFRAIFGIIIFCALFRGIFHYAEQTCNHYIAFKILALLREKVFTALRRLCPAKLEGRDKGNLIAIITSDIELLEVFYAHTISPVAIAFLMSIWMSLFIGSYHWTLGAIAFAAYVIVGILIPMFISKYNGENGKRFRGRSGEMSSFMLESLRGLAEIIQYNMGIDRMSAIRQKTDDLIATEEKMKRGIGYNMAITASVIPAFSFAMLWTAFTLYQQGVIGFDGVLISTVAIMSSFGPTVALANLGSTLQNTFAAGNRVLDILEETPLVEEIEGQKDILFTGAKVEDLSFRYEEEQILSDLSLDIQKSRILGIAGKSGSGKSTLLKLFMRFWEAGQGSVQISGENVNRINTRNLRNMESFVTQETHLFDDTIANNVRIAKLDATDEEVMQACKKASLDGFIRQLPRGYQTRVGELGDRLSGGERQRLGLARVFLHDAPFVLLDEPTSNLDSLNEGVILKSIKEERAEKTVVLVSHRESTLRIADEIYHMKSERVS